MSRAAGVHRLIDGRFELGEGVRHDVHDGRLWWVDILAGDVWTATLTADGLHDVVRHHPGPHTVGVAERVSSPGERDRWWLGADNAVYAWTPGTTPVVVGTPAFGADLANDSGLRINDGALDPRGRMWVGSMAFDASPGRGSLARVDLDGTAVVVQHGMTIPNGIGFSPDGTTMFVTESSDLEIIAWDYDVETGTASRPRLFVSIDSRDGGPDGLTVDSAGQVWTALWDGYAVRCYAPDGRLVRSVKLPMRRPTACAVTPFGLVVTSARFELDDPGEMDGAIVLVDLTLDQ